MFVRAQEGDHFSAAGVSGLALLLVGGRRFLALLDDLVDGGTLRLFVEVRIFGLVIETHRAFGILRRAKVQHLVLVSRPASSGHQQVAERRMHLVEAAIRVHISLRGESVVAHMRRCLLSLASLAGALVAKCADLMASHRVMTAVMWVMRVLVAVVVIVVRDVVDVERLVLVSRVRAQRAARLVVSGNDGHAAGHGAGLVHHL